MVNGKGNIIRLWQWRDRKPRSVAAGIYRVLVTSSHFNINGNIQFYMSNKTAKWTEITKALEFSVAEGLFHFKDINTFLIYEIISQLDYWIYLEVAVLLEWKELRVGEDKMSKCLSFHLYIGTHLSDLNHTGQGDLCTIWKQKGWIKSSFLKGYVFVHHMN